jgi:hypothetical protein
VKFTMRRACLACPFRRSKRFPLRRARMLGIVDSVQEGSAFPCHKTSGKVYARWRACAGWLNYMKKNRLDNAQMQVMQRAGLYRPRRLINDPDLITTRAEIESAEWFR